MTNRQVLAEHYKSKCSYRAQVAYPDSLEAGLRVDKLSRRSVTYGIAIFNGVDAEAVAHGHFVHVFVDREERTAAEIPDPIRDALSRIVVSEFARGDFS